MNRIGSKGICALDQKKNCELTVEGSFRPVLNLLPLWKVETEHRSQGMSFTYLTLESCVSS
jgi:hypothetical protein